MLLLALLPLGVSAQAPPRPALFIPGAAPPAPPPFTHADLASSGPRLSQAVEICAAALADPAVALPVASSPWVAVRPPASIDSNQWRSPSQSVKMSEVAINGVASVGQQFTVPAATTEITGTLSYRYALGTTQAGDKLQVEIYQVGRENIDQPIVAVDVFPPTAAAAQADGNWHPFTWDITDTAKLGTLSGLGHAMFLVTLRSSAAVGPLQQLWVDDIDMGICATSATISGTVTQAGAAAADAQVLLSRTTPVGSAIIANAVADAAGRYSFSGVQPLGSGESYQVWFLNAPTAAARPDGRLGFWAWPTISALGAGQTKAGQDMAVGDVALGDPAAYSVAVATDASPVTLSWAARGVDDRYQLCVYDPQRIDPGTSLPPQVCGPISSALTFALSPQSFGAVPSFDFHYGRSYRWYVVVYDQAGAQSGYSFYERAITLASEPVTPPTAAVTPSDVLPAAAGDTADWTLMVYAAGDNPFGDAASKQIAQLRGLASAYPQLHLVTLIDAYGATGAQLCYLPPQALPDCQERGEIATGDPATLGDFIKTALARYPASHTMLILAGPGHPIGGLGYDLTAAGVPSIDIDGLQSAFDAAGLGVGGKQLDVLFYQASLMGAVEVVSASAPYARYMVAAADEYWSLPFYTSILPLLAGAQKDQPAEVAKGLVSAYSAAVGSYGVLRAHSLAAYDLGRAAAVSAALNSLGGAIQSALTGDSATVRSTLGRMLQSIQAYDSSGNGLINALEQRSGDPISVQDDALIDLNGLASAMNADATLPMTLHNLSGDLLSALKSPTPLVIASAQVSGTGIAGRPISLSGADGLSVFFPTGVRLGGQPAMVQRYLYGASGAPRDSGWAGFLRAYMASELGRGPGGVTAGPLGGAQIRAPIGILTDFYTWMPVMMR